MQRPFTILCLAFCLGILSAIRTAIPTGAILAVSFFCLFAALIFLKNKTWFSIFILLGFILLGAGRLKDTQLLPACHLAENPGLLTKTVSLKGTVISDPVAGKRKTSFKFAVQELITPEGNQKVCGKVLVNAYLSFKYKYGQSLILTGRLFKPYKFPLSSGLDYRQYLRRQGIYAILSVSKKGRVRDLGINRGNPVMRFALWLKARMEEIIVRNLQPLTAGIMNAMVLGERRSVPKWVNQAMIKTGTVHILVVSGFNVGIVAFIFLNFFKALRIPRNPRIWLVILILVVYCLLTGASTPVVRATIMGLIFLCGWLIGRDPDIYNSLSLAAILILAFNPWQILDVGFQLSFVSVLAIVWLHPKIRSWFPVRLLRIRFVGAVIQAFAISLSAWLGTAGLIAYYFHIISPVTVLANVLIVALTSFITACGFALVILGKIFPAWAYFFARSSELAVWGLLQVNSILAGLPAAYFYIDSCPFGLMLAYYMTVIFVGSLKSIAVFLRRPGPARID